MIEKIILGIDPGTTIMGYGLIKVCDNNVSLIALGILDLRKIKDHYVKIKKIFERNLMLIDEFHPDVLAIESPFYGENIQSMLKLGRAQGAAISAALYRDMPIFEYAPKKIKQSITGQGSASKEQVARVLQTMLNLDELPEKLDATDGLAAAICHFLQPSVEKIPGTTNNWKTFLSQNPNRIKK